MTAQAMANVIVHGGTALEHLGTIAMIAACVIVLTRATDVVSATRPMGTAPATRDTRVKPAKKYDALWTALGRTRSANATSPLAAALAHIPPTATCVNSCIAQETAPRQLVVGATETLQGQ